MRGARVTTGARRRDVVRGTTPVSGQRNLLLGEVNMRATVMSRSDASLAVAVALVVGGAVGVSAAFAPTVTAICETAWLYLSNTRG